MGKVIARKVGPKYNGGERGCLTIGKEYEVRGLQRFNYNDGCWIDEPFRFNPERKEFYLKVVDDWGREHHIWNDYFYPSEKEYFREKRLTELLDD